MDIPPAAGFRCRAWSHSSSMLDTEDIWYISPPIIDDLVAWGALVATLWFFLALGKVASFLGNRRASSCARIYGQYCEDHFAFSKTSNKAFDAPRRTKTISRAFGTALRYFQRRCWRSITSSGRGSRRKRWFLNAPHRWLLGMHVQLAASEQVCVFPNAAVYGWNGIVNAPPQH